MLSATAVRTTKLPSGEAVPTGNGIEPSGRTRPERKEKIPPNVPPAVTNL